MRGEIALKAVEGLIATVYSKVLSVRRVQGDNDRLIVEVRPRG